MILDPMQNNMLGYQSFMFISTLLVAGFMQVHAQMEYYEPLLDLNPMDDTTINTTSEYFDMDQVIFLSNMTEFITPNGNWSSITLVITQGEIDIDEMVDIYPDEAVAAGRVDANYRGLFRRTRIVALNLMEYDIDTDLVIDGMLLEVNDGSPFSGGENVMNDTLIEIALNSSGYIVREHPGYAPRIICIIADDMMNHTTACLTLLFIGYNDDPPVVTYEPTSNVTFTEGQMEYIPIIAGDLYVTDPDHPMRYPMMSAQARIIDGYNSMTEHTEFLGVTYEHPGFLYNYDMDTGVLTITGNAMAEMYEQLLSNLTYFNNMTEPLGDSRSIVITVFDGKFTSQDITVLVIINNTNDAPVISLDGAMDPVSQQFSINYTEGMGAQAIVPNIQVVDTDPNAMINRVVVTLTNPIDGADEQISIPGPAMGLTITPTSPSHSIEISGIAAESMYTAVLRTLTYQHLDSDPGNPSTTEPRILEFYVEDDQNAANIMNSTLELTIIPVNDDPILLFVSDPAVRENPIPVLSGVTQMSFTYTEDDPPLNFGRDIYLRDVDGNISLAILNLTSLLDGAQDEVYADPALLNAYGVVMEVTSESQSSRVIVLNSTAYEGNTPTAFEEILRSLSYINRYPDNRVTDGQRMLSIMATDTSGADSNSISVDITVADRNDGPVVDVGGGDSMDFVTTFVENGGSIPIALSHLIDIMDEEMHDISSIAIELIATNGNLDPSDSIFLRSPMSLLFLDNFAAPPTTTFIHIALNATVAVYEQALRAVYFDNSEIEPTIFNATGANLTRIVVIRITDTNFPDSGLDNAELGTTTTEIRIGINIQPINDNRPRILILAEPEGCATGSVNVSEAQANIRRRRRDVRAASSIRKRSIRGFSNVMAPQLTSTSVHLTTVPDSVTCVQNITIEFDVNTSIPILEVSSKLESLISFDVQELNSAKKFGRWMDHRTMAVLFAECVSWDSRTTSGKDRPIHIVFEADGGDCDWSTPCMSGVCFANNTGCPVVGAYILSYNQSTSDETTKPEIDYSEDKRHHHYIVGVFASVVAGIMVAIFLSCIATRNRKAEKPQKVATFEDIESSTTIELSPVVHKQQPKAEDIHSRVQDLYPPPPNPYNSVNTDNNDHKIMKNVLPEPSLPCPQKPPEASPIANVQILHPPAPSVASADSTLQSTTHHDVDSTTVTSPIEGRTTDAVCLSKEAIKDNLKQQTPNKRKKKRVKTTSPKVVENSNQDKLELKRPVSDDICSWLQLEDSESKELDERLQQYTSRSHDQSHDLQAVVSISDSQDAKQSTHHQIALNNSTKECRLSPERKATLHMHTPSPLTQQKRLSDSETISNVQSTTRKF